MNKFNSSADYRFAYQKTHRFFGQIDNGLEKPGVEELKELGASDVKVSYRGLYFSADNAALYRINYKSRLLTHVLAPLLTFDCHSDRYLYKTAKSLPWGKLISIDNTFAIEANVSGSRIKHSQYAAQRLKDAIADHFREISGERPDVDTRSPDLWLNLYVHNNKATISADTSGGSLHRRGYREASVTAPMQETVAAAIIRLSEWKGERPLYDPMCGSGTLLAEAFMNVCRIPAGYLRVKFGFMQLPDFDQAIWENVKNDCIGQIKPLPRGLIGGSDILGTAVDAASTNLAKLPGGEKVNVKKLAFQNIDSLKDTVIICNPPYGLRSKNAAEASALLDEFVTFLKERCSGSVVYIYLGRKELFKDIYLRASWKKPVNNGGLHGYLVRYDIR